MSRCTIADTVRPPGLLSDKILEDVASYYACAFGILSAPACDSTLGEFNQLPTSPMHNLSVHDHLETSTNWRPLVISNELANCAN